jgi:DNA invertase Pin-like site-specific DNA recombinase
MFMKTRVVGYIRVSTEGQAEAGVSLEAQRAKLEAYAVACDLDLVTVEVDAGVSAKTLHRPALQAALARLDSGEADGLLVAKLDRLTRSVRDLGDLVERYFSARFSLLSVADSIDTRSAAGRLVLNVLASVAQWEREATGERTREALAHVKAQGVRLGGEGLGWRRSAERDAAGRAGVVHVESEAATLRRIAELRAGGLTLREIAERLEAEGHRTKRGGSWHASTVAAVLRRARPRLDEARPEAA